MTAAPHNPAWVEPEIAAAAPGAAAARIQHGRRVAYTALTLDLAAIAVAMAGFMLPFRTRHGPALMDADLLLAAVAIATVLASLYLSGAWESRRRRMSPTASARRGYLFATSILAVLWLVLDIDRLHLWILAALPVALALSMLSRSAMTALAGSRRCHAPPLPSAMIVGDRAGLHAFLAQRRGTWTSMWRVDAVCLANEFPGASIPDSICSLPIAGIDADLADLARQNNYEAIILLPSAGFSPEQVRDLMWQLEDSTVDILIAPPIMDVASNRLHVTTVSGIPLLHVVARSQSSPALAAKTTVDRVAALFGILLLLPLLAAIALCIRLSSSGPALYRQTRIGIHNQAFTIYKFRTMTQNAETMLHQLHDQNDGAGPLFKCFEDPRVTRIGRILRRYSIDELPQLFNVALGSMSLVGPRPPLPAQVDQYRRADERRRLLVRPGMTGLWQVSGRSDLSWSESVQHDLYYVENWTIGLDTVILWKTAGAVASGRGAY